MAWLNLESGSSATLTGCTFIGEDSSSATSYTTRNSFVNVTYNSYVTDLGTEIKFEVIKDKNKVIHPQMYFKFVKSKMTKMQQKEMHERLSKLQKLVVGAKDLGQKALYEELSRKIAITVKEQEMNVCGIEYIIPKEAIEKYRNKIKDVDIGLCSIENYTRPIPSNVSKRLKKCQELKLFDNYYVLYLEYKNKIDVGGTKKQEKAEKKTNKEKIKEKDPILFGVQDYDRDKFYFIIDWIDEYCDLTLDKFVDTIKRDDPNYNLDKISDMTPELMQKLIAESKERYERLRNTNSKNYKDLMKEEDNAYVKVIKPIVNDFRNKVKNILNNFENKYIKKIRGNK